MRKYTPKFYAPTQIVKLNLTVLVLMSTFGFFFTTSTFAQAPATSVSSRSRILPTDTNGQLQFASPGYTITEGQASTVVTVTRSGTVSGTVSASVIVTDITTTPSDYQFSSGVSFTAGSIDPSLSSTIADGFNSFPNGILSGVAVQPDGKILIVGDISRYNGGYEDAVVRFNQDGSLDRSFTKADGYVRHYYAIAVQPDGKIIIAGSFFDAVNFPPPYKFMTRLNPDGSTDGSFHEATPNFDGWIIRGVAAQPDGKIMVVGEFNGYQGETRPGVARLNSDGSLDPSFVLTGTGLDAFPSSVAVQPDGKILLMGGFNNYNGITEHNLVRLNSDGSLDTSFNPNGTGITYKPFSGYSVSDVWLPAIAVQPDGEILISAHIGSYNGTPVYNNIARLNPDGTLDTTFYFGGGNPYIDYNGYALATSPDGKILAVNSDSVHGGNYYIKRLYGSSGTTLTWPDGDNSPKSVTIKANKDFLNEPTETAQIGLTNLQGGAIIGPQVPANLTILNCDQLMVTSTADDGNCGTLRQAVEGLATGPANSTITLNLQAGSVISLTQGLTVTQGITITTSTNCGSGPGGNPGVVLQGTGSNSGVGLTLLGGNHLYDLWVRGFSGGQIVAPNGGGNVLQCVKATKS